jgi:hypothetical protein
LFADGSPRQPFLISEPYNFIPAKHTSRSADDLSGSLSSLDARKSALSNHFPLKFRNAGKDLE